jgi:hypothetical protein
MAGKCGKTTKAHKPTIHTRLGRNKNLFGDKIFAC